MKAITTVIIAAFFGSLTCRTGEALVVPIDIEGKTWNSDVVAVGKPVRKQSYTASRGHSFEISTFEVSRVLCTRRGIAWVDDPFGEGPRRICVVRQYKDPTLIWKIEELDLNRDYLLFLKRIPHAQMFCPYFGFPQFYEPTEENLKKVVKALSGRADFAFRKEPVTLEKADELAGEHLKIILDAVRKLEDRKDEEIIEYLDSHCMARREREDYIFKPLLCNPDIVMITVEGSLELDYDKGSSSGPVKYFYSPIFIHEVNSFLPSTVVGRGKSKTTKDAVFFRGEMTIGGVPLGQVVTVEATTTTRKGKRTIRIWYKADKREFGVFKR